MTTRTDCAHPAAFAWVPAMFGPRRARCTSCGHTRRARTGERLSGDPANDRKESRR